MIASQRGLRAGAPRRRAPSRTAGPTRTQRAARPVADPRSQRARSAEARPPLAERAAAHVGSTPGPRKPFKLHSARARAGAAAPGSGAVPRARAAGPAAATARPAAAGRVRRRGCAVRRVRGQYW